MIDAEYWDALADPLPVRALAPLLREHESTVHRHLQDGTIPGHYIARSWIVFKCEIRAWLLTQRNIPSDEEIDPDPLTDWPDELRVPQLMEFFGKTKQTIRRWLEDSTIPGYRINNRWIVYKAELRELLAATSNQQTDDDPLAGWPDELGVHELMEFFGKTKQTIYRWLGNGTIPGHRDNNRWIVYKAELGELLAARSSQQH